MMEENGDWARDTPFASSFVRFFDELFPGVDNAITSRNCATTLKLKRFDGLTVTLKDAAFMKLFCDAYFLAKIFAPKPSAPNLRKRSYLRRRLIQTNFAVIARPPHVGCWRPRAILRRNRMSAFERYSVSC